jgi:hypothetical protein
MIKINNKQQAISFGFIFVLNLIFFVIILIDESWINTLLPLYYILILSHIVLTLLFPLNEMETGLQFLEFQKPKFVIRYIIGLLYFVVWLMAVLSSFDQELPIRVSSYFLVAILISTVWACNIAIGFEIKFYSTEISYYNRNIWLKLFYIIFSIYIPLYLIIVSIGFSPYGLILLFTLSIGLVFADYYNLYYQTSDPRNLLLEYSAYDKVIAWLKRGFIILGLVFLVNLILIFDIDLLWLIIIIIISFSLIIVLELIVSKNILKKLGH